MTLIIIIIIGIDWLHQQGYFQWDFDKGRIRFGEEDWIELYQEHRSISRLRPVLSGLNEESDSTLESNFNSFRETAREIPFSVSAIVRGSNYVPISSENEFLPPVLQKFEELPLPVQRKLDEDCVPVQDEEECECKSELDSTSARMTDTILNSTSASSSVGGARPVRAKNQCLMEQHRIACQFSSWRRTLSGMQPNQSSRANSCTSPTRAEF